MTLRSPFRCHVPVQCILESYLSKYAFAIDTTVTDIVIGDVDHIGAR